MGEAEATRLNGGLRGGELADMPSHENNTNPSPQSPREQCCTVDIFHYTAKWGLEGSGCI